MMFKKMWAALRAQLNKLANVFWEADPIAQMRYEYDMAVEQLKDGRKGLEMYRGLVERVSRQVGAGERHFDKLKAQAKAYLKAGDRETAAKFALEMQKAQTELKQNQQQLVMHEKSYENNLKKIKRANKKLAGVREKITKYDAELRMSEAEAEIAKLAQAFDLDVTTDFGQLETIIQERIDQNRGTARVATDLSQEGIAEIEAEEKMEAVLADDALRELELELGLVSPETSPVTQTAKDLGPATEDQTN